MTLRCGGVRCWEWELYNSFVGWWYPAFRRPQDESGEGDTQVENAYSKEAKSITEQHKGDGKDNNTDQRMGGPNVVIVAS